MALFTDAGVDGWSEVRSRLQGSSGAFHLRWQVFRGYMSKRQMVPPLKGAIGACS